MDSSDVFATPPPGTGHLGEWGRIIAVLAGLEAAVRAQDGTLKRIEMVMDTNFRALNDRDAQQSNEIQNLTVRGHKIVSDLETLCVEFDKLEQQHVAETGALREQLTAAIDARKALAGRLDGAFELLNQLNNRERKLEDSQEQCKILLSYVTPQPGESKSVLLKIVERVDLMWPWMQGIMWAMPIAGGFLVLAIVGAILWAIVQSGVGLP